MRPITPAVVSISAGVAVAAVALSAGLAGAAFPGSNARIAFDSTRSGAVNILTVDPTAPDAASISASVRQVTTSGNIDETPYGSPNGLELVFRSDRVQGNNAGNIFLADSSANLDQLLLPPDGAVQLTTGTGDDKTPSFVTDSVVIFSHADPGGKYQLRTVPVATPGAGTLVVSSGGCDDVDPMVNPVHVNQIAFTRTCAASAPHVMLLDTSVALSASNPKDLTAANGATYPVTQDVEPDWSPDGTHIAVAGTGPSMLFSGLSQIYAILPDGSGRTPFWPTGRTKNDRSPSYSPDGTKLAFTENAATTGTDVWTTELSALTSVTSAQQPKDVTPARGPDLHPSWLPTFVPPTDVPEVPMVPLLALSAGLIGLGAHGLVRRRGVRRLS
jgi:hypothetical protein